MGATSDSRTTGLSMDMNTAASGNPSNAYPPSGSPADGGDPPGPVRSPGEPLSPKLRWFTEWFRPQFDHWVIAPIDRLAPSQDALASFVLMSCAIDYLASFWFGKDTKSYGGVAYRGFIDSYLRDQNGHPYDSVALYQGLRNGLVHLFTLKGAKFVLKHKKPAWHLKQIPNGPQIVLNAESLLEDLKRAKEAYFSAVENNGMSNVTNKSLLHNAWDRYERDGFFNYVETGFTD